MVKPSWPRYTGLFVFGALVGSLFDGFHTHSGAIAYPHPWVHKMAWWTPLLFGMAALGIATTHVRLDRRLLRQRRALPGPVVAGGMAYFGAFYYLSGFLHASNPGKLAALLLGWLCLWLLVDRTWQGIVLALSTAAIGCAVEVTLTSLGLFTHLRPDRWGIPCWLPALYMLASLTVGNLGRASITPPAHCREE